MRAAGSHIDRLLEPEESTLMKKALITEITDQDGADGTPRKLLDVTRLNALGWKPRIPLRQGLRETYEWYLANREK